MAVEVVDALAVSGGWYTIELSTQFQTIHKTDNVDVEILVPDAQGVTVRFTFNEKWKEDSSLAEGTPIRFQGTAVQIKAEQTPRKAYCRQASV